MNKYDAAKVLNLTGTFTPETLKTAYRQACKQYHPDRNPAGLEMMKMVNVAYAVLEKVTAPFTLQENTQAYGEAVNTALTAIITLSDLVIEICGAWVWVSGNTQAHKDILKAAGFFWAPKKMCWYFRPEDYKSRNRGRWSMDTIRHNYGSHIVESKKEEHRARLSAA